MNKILNILENTDFGNKKIYYYKFGWDGLNIDGNKVYGYDKIKDRGALSAIIFLLSFFGRKYDFEYFNGQNVDDNSTVIIEWGPGINKNDPRIKEILQKVGGAKVIQFITDFNYFTPKDGYQGLKDILEIPCQAIMGVIDFKEVVSGINELKDYDLSKIETINTTHLLGISYMFSSLTDKIEKNGGTDCFMEYLENEFIEKLNIGIYAGNEKDRYDVIKTFLGKPGTMFVGKSETIGKKLGQQFEAKLDFQTSLKLEESTKFSFTFQSHLNHIHGETYRIFYVAGMNKIPLLLKNKGIFYDPKGDALDINSRFRINDMSEFDELYKGVTNSTDGEFERKLHREFYRDLGKCSKTIEDQIQRFIGILK